MTVRVARFASILRRDRLQKRLAEVFQLARADTVDGGHLVKRCRVFGRHFDQCHVGEHHKGRHLVRADKFEPERLEGGEAELAKRRKDLKTVEGETLRGYDKLYAEEVLQADEGCDFAFLKSV